MSRNRVWLPSMTIHPVTEITLREEPVRRGVPLSELVAAPLDNVARENLVAAIMDDGQ